MQNLTRFEFIFLELLRGLSNQQRADLIRIMEAFLQSVE